MDNQNTKGAKEKSTIEEIRARFDADVERFSNEETGQTSTVDSGIAIDMLAKSISGVHKNAGALLDIGCGAGNFTIRILKGLPGLSCDLIDLSKPMLDRAVQRVSAQGGKIGRVIQDDVRSLDLGTGSYDIVVAAAVLHHLRSRVEWRDLLSKIYTALRPGGGFWMWDLIRHEHPVLQQVQSDRYGEYLKAMAGENYKNHVFDYVDREDSPESVAFITQVLSETGFGLVEIVHKNSLFAGLMALKS